MMNDAITEFLSTNETTNAERPLRLHELVPEGHEGDVDLAAFAMWWARTRGGDIR